MESFRIHISQNKIAGLKNRIKNTRWIEESAPATWITDTDVKYLKELSDYWLNAYDWKKQESFLNSFKQYTTKIDSLKIHFLYEKGTGTKHIPILLLHGWASCYTKYLKLVEMFKKENQDVDLIVPSHPAFAFSETPATAINSGKVASIMHNLMTKVLGYDRYYVHGGDFGSFVGEKMAMDYPEAVKGLHLSDIPYYHLYGYNENLSQEEENFINRINEWSMQDGAYAGIQGSKPKTLSCALNDSPVGLAAWLLQLFNDFSDKSKPIETKYNRDELLTNISIYWFTETIYSSMRIYTEDTHGFGEPVIRKTSVPTGFCFYPFDISGIPPKAFANRFFTNIVSWTEQKSGGHFGAMENPFSLYLDLVDFMKTTSD